MSTAPQLNKAEKSVKDFTEKLIKKLPKINNKTRNRAPLDKLQNPDFIYQLPNPTIQHGNAAPDITKLDANAFLLLGSQVVLFGPDIFWGKLVQIRCPLCKEPAAPHGWCKEVRRVCGLHCTYFVAGRRYKCVGCRGG
jgi:hypothetical protein